MLVWGESKCGEKNGEEVGDQSVNEKNVDVAGC